MPSCETKNSVIYFYTLIKFNKLNWRRLHCIMKNKHYFLIWIQRKNTVLFVPHSYENCLQFHATIQLFKQLLMSVLNGLMWMWSYLLSLSIDTLIRNNSFRIKIGDELFQSFFEYWNTSTNVIVYGIMFHVSVKKNWLNVMNLGQACSNG